MTSPCSDKEKQQQQGRNATAVMIISTGVSWLSCSSTVSSFSTTSSTSRTTKMPSPQREARNEAYLKKKFCWTIVNSAAAVQRPFSSTVFEQQQHTSLSSAAGSGNMGRLDRLVRELLFACGFGYRNRQRICFFGGGTTSRRPNGDGSAPSFVFRTCLAPNFASIFLHASTQRALQHGFWNGGRSLVRVEWLVFHLWMALSHADLLSNATTRTGNVMWKWDDDARHPLHQGFPTRPRGGSFGWEHGFPCQRRSILNC